VGTHFAPEGVTTQFTAGTSTVYAVAKIHGKAKGDVVKFIWQYPDGSTFALEIPDVTPYKGDVTAYAQITPRGPGTYTVTTTISGHNLASESFTVAAHGATTPVAQASTSTEAAGSQTPSLSETSGAGVATVPPSDTPAGQ
jgi:hypothetical protein